MRVLVFAELSAQQLGGTVGNDLVAVHVEADAGAGLKNIDDKVVVPLALLHFLGGFDDGVGGLLVDQPELAIGFGGSLFHHGDGAYEGGMRAQSADGIVLHRARRLNAIVGVGGNFLMAKRIFFSAGGGRGGRAHEILLAR